MKEKKKRRIPQGWGNDRVPSRGLVVILSVSPLLPQSNKILKLKKNVEKVVLGLWRRHTELFMKGNCHGAAHGERERENSQLHCTRSHRD